MLAELIGLFLTVWLLLSILNQFSFSFIKKITQHDKCALLPRWTFFAPNPGCTDFRLVYRTFDEQELPSAWKEVCMVRERAWSDAIWNPDKRLLKAVVDLAQALLAIRRTYDDPTVLITSFPYVVLAHYLDCQPRLDPSAKSWQFMVIQTHGVFTESSPDLLIRSKVHNVHN
jgi:hypothetical protein